jgi:D-glucosaminate-6-phosphate ammonia-lyase
MRLSWEKMKKSLAGYSRRDLFRGGGLLAAAQALGPYASQAATTPLDIGPNLYRSIGVRPLINAHGTFTIITGSETLPEVKRAMDEASRGFVHMDELMDGVGQRLADITGAEWGIITAGCCAALTHLTSASIAGFNPERMQRLPNLTGLKSEVIIPAYSRNVYDHAIRMLGVKIVEVKEPAALEAAFNEHTAMVYILGGPGDDGPLGTRVVAEVARRKNVPVVVDAAAEILTLKPNVHLERGASAVVYSGGKCIRGPQAAGLLLGEKNWLKSAWANSAPHHAYGRSVKVGKEEIMGMLAAVEMWVKRDHKAEWRQWEAWLGTISDSVTKIDGVSAKITQPSADLSNRSPRLTVQWDGARLGITGQELNKLLLDTEPRIMLDRGSGQRPGNMASSVSIVPYMMMPGEEKIVADRLHAVLSKPPKFENPPAPPEGQPATVSGQWEAHLEFGRGSANNTLVFEQDGSKLQGTHHTEFYATDLNGTVAANTLRFQSSWRIEGQRLSYTFSGTVDGDHMSGVVNMGEYGETTWTAQRHKYSVASTRRAG